MSTLSSVLDFFEDHPVSVNVLCAIVGAIGGITIFELYKKRQNASSDFYVKLSSELFILWETLEQTKQLELILPENGNIYSLSYGPRIRELCPGYHIPNDNELRTLADNANRILVILAQSNNIVHPSGLTQGKWIEDLNVISSFCRFLNAAQNNTIIPVNPNLEDNNQLPHIKKCNQLVEAIIEIQNTINH